MLKETINNTTPPCAKDTVVNDVRELIEIPLVVYPTNESSADVVNWCPQEVLLVYSVSRHTPTEHMFVKADVFTVCGGCEGRFETLTDRLQSDIFVNKLCWTGEQVALAHGDELFAVAVRQENNKSYLNKIFGELLAGVGKVIEIEPIYRPAVHVIVRSHEPFWEINNGRGLLWVADHAMLGKFAFLPLQTDNQHAADHYCVGISVGRCVSVPHWVRFVDSTGLQALEVRPHRYINADTLVLPLTLACSSETIKEAVVAYFKDTAQQWLNF